MREKIARLRAKQHFLRMHAANSPDPALAEIYAKQSWSGFMDEAAAILQIVRIPTKPMLAAGMSAAEDAMDSDWDSGPHGEDHNVNTTLRSDAPLRIFQAMLADRAVRTT